MEGKRLLRNTVFLTITSLTLRLAGLVFQVFLSKMMGAGGIGLFTLVMSVNGFMATLAISGIRFATTRVISEDVGSGREGEIGQTVRRCLLYAVFCGISAAVLIFFSAGFIGSQIIGDARTVLSLRILGLSLPFVSAGACLSGYFTGVCRVGRSAAASIAEEVLKIAFSIAFLSLVPGDDLELVCAAVVAGNVAGEIVSFLIIFALYRLDIRRYRENEKKTVGILRRVTGIAVPLALAAYARMALNTLQNLLIPNGFERSGASKEAALADYGTIQGMVFPIMTFPAVVFAAVSELIVPELTEEQVQGRTDRIESAANTLLRLALIFAFLVTGALFAFSDELGEAIYGSADVGRYIRYLSLLMPVMYMDTVTDGMLRGLGQHLYSMRLNIVDSLITSAMIWFLLPKFAVKGYIFILYASEIFNFSLSILKLSKLTRLHGFTGGLLKIAISALGAVNITQLILRGLGAAEPVMIIIVGIILFIICYFLLLFGLGAIKRRDFGRLRLQMR